MVIGRLNFKQSNWLFGRLTDLFFLFIPIWIMWCVFFCKASYIEALDLPTWAWVVFILGIDVGHVWSSFFRTYFQKDEFLTHKNTLIVVPFILLTSSIIILTVSTALFWRIMAYLAVFHFIKQQYGFAMLYKVKRGENRTQFFTDKLIVYIATIYPILFWHFNSSSNFNWFVQNDFLPIHQWVNNIQLLDTIFLVLNCSYWLVIISWLIQEIIAAQKKTISYGKICWILTTAVNWWFSIVYFNSDLVFSISNVVAHGVPYFVLIYYYRMKKSELLQNKQTKWGWRLKWILVLIFTVLVAAFIEEYFWDMLIYREHDIVFEFVLPYNWEQISRNWIIVLTVAILALPQQIHYIMDGVIWKMNNKNPYIKSIFKPSNES